MKAHEKLFGTLAALGLLALSACDDSGKKEVPFEYQSILEQEFQDAGRSIPLTFEQSVDVDGVFSGDGLYFFYASDRESGNYDIYLRSLTSITTVRLTSHPSKDTMPSVSPDGKYLAFVSSREDPEGDIYSVRVKSKKLIEQAEASVSDIPSLDQDAKNLTQFQDPQTRTIRIIKDTTPAWSPDSRLIAFSSSRDGRENIWVMNRKGGNLRQVTRDGGTSPRFSEDGTRLVFVSYRDAGSKGDIYTCALEGGDEKRITSTPAIELSPSFMKTGDEIVFARIDRDTNRDGQVNLKDDAALIYKNVATGIEFPLTLKAQSSFNPRWSPAMNGVIVYSEQTGQNININIIPETGIIPRKESAGSQFELADRYLVEFDDVEKYLMCLENVYHFFGARTDVDSMVFTAKALAAAAIKYNEMGEQVTAQRMLRVLSAYSADRSDYRNIIARCAAQRMYGQGCADVLLAGFGDVSADRTRENLVPFLMEDLADEYARQGRYNDSVLLYQRIIAEQPQFARLVNIHYKYAASTYTRLQGELSPSYVEVLGSKKGLLVNDSINSLLAVFDGERNAVQRAGVAAAMLQKYKDIRLINGMLRYVSGKSLAEAGDAKSAKAELLEALKVSEKTDLVYYKANLLLSEISEQEKDVEEFEEYLTEAITSYDLQWRQKDIRDVIQRLVDYYEDRGERAENDRKYKRATAIYGRYVKLVSYLQSKRRFTDMVSQHGARAHVLYIDAYALWKGNKVATFKELEEKYTGKAMRKARRNFDNAYMYGLGYLYTRLAVAAERKAESSVVDIIGFENKSIDELLGYFKSAVEHLDWALFIDDTFIDAYILKGWIYQYVDLRRNEDQQETGGKNEKQFAEFFPKYLWEKNLALYERALLVNRESDNPEKEGNLHLNIANTYFLLKNYPRALQHYLLVDKYKTAFRSKIEEALFRYHYSYSYWQDAQYPRAREEMSKAFNIYQSLATGKKVKIYRKQILTMYHYFALLSRMENKYTETIGWYNSILSFASRNKVKIDKARYMQEIAYCYGELGDTGKTLQYLGKARVLLKKYKDDEKTYKLRWKLLGLGPISFIDLGPDVAVIGGNRIYSRLDTFEKKILNFSMQEDVFFERGNYRKSIEILKKKLKQLEERSTKIDKETKTKTLNNIGFGYFKLRDYKESLNYFKQAWDYAASDDVYDLEGIFESIINVANLYAFLLDENPEAVKKPVKEIDKLISRITEYKDGYEEMRFKQELAVMKDDASLRKKKVTAEQVQELRERVKEEATSIYFTIDIAIGVLNYYKAEIIFNAEPPKLKGGSVEDKAFSFYAGNRDLFNIYAEALQRFDAALLQAERSASKTTLVKLLLNTSACRQRMGMMDLAYESLTAAQNTARANGYSDLEWIVSHETARFLSKYGESVEGKEAAARSGEYFRNAIAVVEEAPPVHSSYYNRIKRLYDEYAELLLSKGDWKSALIVSEKKYETLRTITVCLSAPQFRNPRDTEYFNAYMEKIYLIDGLNRQISALFEAGEQPGAEKVKPLEDARVLRKAELADFKMRLILVSPLIASNLFGTGGSSAVPEGVSVYKLLISGNKVYGWKVEAGGAEFKDLGPAAGDPQALASSLKLFIGAGTIRFVALDSHSYSLLEALRDSGIPFMFIPSIERSRYYVEGEKGAFTSAYYNASGIKKRLAGSELTAGIAVTEGKTDDVSLATFSIVVDDDASEMTIQPEQMFSERVSPSLLFKEMAQMEADSINYYAEAALYSGTRSLIFCTEAKTKDFSLMIQQAVQGTFEAFALAPSMAKYKPVCVGFRGADQSERAKSSLDVKEASFRNYLAAFAAGNYKEAATDLQNWKELHGDDPESLIKFELFMAEIDLARERGIEALKRTATAMNEAGKNFPDLYLKASGMRAYCLLREGSAEAAKLILNNLAGAGSADSSDYLVYSGILALVEGDFKAGIDAFEMSKSAKLSYVSPLRQRLLAVEYLLLLGNDAAASKLAAELQPDFSLSQREICKLLLLTGLENQALPDRRTASVLSLRKEASIDTLKSGALLLLEENGEYDYLSPFPVIMAMERMATSFRLSAMDEIADGVDAEDLVKGSFWMDAAPLIFKICSFYERQQNYDDSLEFRLKALEVGTQREIAPLKRRYFYELASVLSRMGRHKESYSAAEKGIPSLNEKDGTGYLRYQIMLMDEEISIGKYGKAEERAVKMSGEMPDEYKYVRELLLAKIQHAKLEGKKTATDDDWRELEARITGALSVLDRSPSTLQRFDRIDLVQQNLNYLISRKADQNDHAAALLYAEIKKQAEGRSAFPALVAASAVPEPVVNEFKGLKDRALGSVRFTELLNEYPYLQVSALAGLVPLEQFQRMIPVNTAVFYIVRNKADILAWAISGISINAIPIPGGYERAAKISERYKADLSSFNNIVSVSRDLAELFKPLESYFNEKPRLVFITDRDMEDVPFEIIGENDMLETTHSIDFLSSIISSQRRYVPLNNNAAFFDTTRRSVYQELESIALGQLGIPKKTEKMPAMGVGHVLPQVLHNSESGDLLMDGRAFSGFMKGYGALYLASADFTGSIGYSDAALYASLQGIGSLIINDAEIHDVNGALFVNEFYARFAAGSDFRSAFVDAKSALRSRLKYRYPAYWAGIRMFLNSL